MKWMRITLPLLCSLFPAVSVHAEATASYLFQLTLNQPVEGMTYALYEDKEEKIPIENSSGEPVTLVTDETGKASVMVSDHDFYLRQTRTVPGWYAEPEAIPVSSESLKMEAHPVRYEFSETKDNRPVSAHLQLFDEKKKIIADWQSEESSVPLKDDKPAVLEAGETYILRDPEKADHEICEDVRFRIPYYYEKDRKDSITLKRKTYGTVRFHTSVAGKKVPGKACVSYYLDREGKEAALNIHGEKETGQTDSEGIFQSELFPGTYYYRVSETDSSYYADPAFYQIRAEAGKTVETDFQLKPVLADLKMTDPDGNRIEGTMILSGDGTEQKIDSAVVHLKRNTDYVLKAGTYPAGYHATQEISFHTPEEEESIRKQCLILTPFQVSVMITDEETGRNIPDAVFCILNDTGQELMRSGSGLLKTSALHDCASYRIHCLSMPDGYLIPDDRMMEIGQTGDYVFSVVGTPYVNVSANCQVKQNQKLPQNVKWSLYQDEECRNPAADIHGEEIRNADGVRSVRNGTYYMKVMTDDPHFYEDSRVYRIQADHAVKATAENEIYLMQADYRVKVQNPDGKKVPGVKLEVMNEKGQTLGKFESSGDDLLTEAGLNENPVPGEILYLKIRNVPGQYTWQERRTRITVPQERPDQVPAVMLAINPYVSLDLTEADEVSGTSGSTYALFENEDCTLPAHDIHSAKTEDITDEKGRIHWDMRNGTYWLKEIKTESSAYLNMVPVRIVLDAGKRWKEYQHFATVRPVIRFTTADSVGNMVAGGKYEIHDENGKEIYHFQSGGTVELKGKWLTPGKTIVIHETEQAAGYQRHETDIRYAVPEAVPDRIPEIRIHYLKKTMAKTKTGSRRKNEATAEEKGKPLILAGAAAALTGIIIVVKIISNKNEKEIKNN